MIADAEAPILGRSGSIVRIPDNRASGIDIEDNGGVYDTINTAWSVVSGGGTITPHGGTRLGIDYTPPNVSQDTEVVLRCVVTVRGTGTYATANTQDVAQIDIPYTVFDA